MATSTLTLYMNSGMKQENNYIVEYIGQYLRMNAEGSRVIENFQYIKNPASPQAFKVSIPQDGYNNSVIDYASLLQDGDMYYYFIVDAKWTSQDCLTLMAVLDTLNTFQDQYSLTDRSYVEREHVNRFKLQGERPTGDSIDEVVWNVISDTKEELQPALYKDREPVVMQGTLPVDSKYTWYLIYQTKQGEGTGVASGAPEILCCADRDIDINPGNTSLDTYTIEPRMLLDHSYVAFGNIHIQFRTSGGVSHDEEFEGYIAVFTDGTEPAQVNINFGYYNGLNNYNGPIEGNLTFVLNHLLILYESPEQGKYSLDQEYVMNSYPWTAYGSNDTLLGIQSIDRTKSNISKVIECPYCPLDIRFATDGRMIVPTEWHFRESDGKLYCDNLSYKFPERQVDYEDTQLPAILGQSIKAQRSKLSQYSRKDHQDGVEGNVVDPKTYISTLSGLMFVYDDNTWQVLPENMLPPTGTVGSVPSLVTISYKQSNNISSECGFKFAIPKVEYLTQGYYDNYMFSVRNNELPLYYSEYINYIRNGYNYDQKQNWNSVRNNMVGVLGSGLNAAALGIGTYSSTQAAYNDQLDAYKEKMVNQGYTEIERGKFVDLWGQAAPQFKFRSASSGYSFPSLVSNAVGIGTGIYNTIASHLDGEEAIKRRVNDARSKAFSVSTTNNLDLFNWYSDNKVVMFTMKPKKDMEELINDYFSLYGYTRGYYEVPDLDSRLWFNYCRGTVDIDNYKKKRSLEENKADIVQRFQQGVYKIHRVNTPLGTFWDMKLERQNYERAILPESWCR